MLAFTAYGVFANIVVGLKAITRIATIKPANVRARIKLMPQNDKFKGTLTEKDLGMIEDALEISKAFKVYGDGRKKHQKEIDKLILKLYKEFWN